jgi:hypothetical protein
MKFHGDIGIDALNAILQPSSEVFLKVMLKPVEELN